MSEGRRRDLLLIVGTLRQVEGGRNRVVLVSGETGIGKSHLARAAADQLAAEGFRVAWGRADPVERAVPYAAIAEALKSLQPAVDTLAWRSASGDDAVLLDVFRPVAALLEDASSRSPLVIVIDDLHYADVDTILLIR